MWSMQIDLFIYIYIYIRHTKKHVYITCAYREKLGKAATLSRFWPCITLQWMYPGKCTAGTQKWRWQKMVALFNWVIFRFHVHFFSGVHDTWKLAIEHLLNPKMDRLNSTGYCFFFAASLGNHQFQILMVYGVWCNSDVAVFEAGAKKAKVPTK